MRAQVTFGDAGPVAEVEVGATLREAATVAGVILDAPCAGVGRCGNCRVRAFGALAPASPEEAAILGEVALAGGIRLACRARVLGDAGVRPTPRGETRALGFGVAGAAEPDPIAEGAPELGAAVDLGTTTIAMALIDLRTGAVLGRATTVNPQVADGHDVVSRIAVAGDGGAQRLQRAAVGAIESELLGMLETMGMSVESLDRVYVAGNTAMISLFLGKDVRPLAQAPYLGAHTQATRVGAATLGFGVLTETVEVSTAPAASAFVGGDITAGLLATGVLTAEEPTVLVDLGTNGEIVVACDGRLVAASAAVGPALEGATITCGMRAEPGAIERVEVAQGDLALTTVDACEACGVCGSGLLDLVAALLDAGLLERSGRLVRSDAVGVRVPSALAARLGQIDGVATVRLARGVHLSQGDIRQVQLAKAAVRAALDSALEAAGIDVAAIERVVVAGGFGYHVAPEALARIGMIPAAWVDGVEFAGNAALEGAHRLLVSARARASVEAAAGAIETVDLVSSGSFQERFIGELVFESD